jgi:hypothetical protein
MDYGTAAGVNTTNRVGDLSTLYMSPIIWTHASAVRGGVLETTRAGAAARERGPPPLPQ